MKATAPIKIILLIILLQGAPGNATGQELTRDLLPEMVQLVDGQINMDDRQEQLFLQLLERSYAALQKIRASSIPELDKMAKILAHQKEVDKELAVLFTPEQYAAYKGFLHTDTPETAEAGAASETDGRVIQLAAELGLKEEKKDQFVKILDELDARTAGIIRSPEDPDQVGIELLTEILFTDILLIRLIGRDAYSEFFRRRSEGALTGSDAGGGADISSVLNFYDIATTLNLSDPQTRSVIGQVLTAEAAKAELQVKYKSNPAMLAEKLRLHDQQGLMDLQKILTAGQWDKFLRLIGQE